MPDIKQQEFLEKFENTKYPFTDASTLKDDTGTFLIPKTLFTDASLYPPGVKGNLYISRIDIGINDAELIIQDDVTRKTFFGKIASSKNNVLIKDEYHRVVGILCADKSRLSYLFACSLGSYTFAPRATMFVSRCVFQDPGFGVSSINCGADDLCGKVWLVGGDGVFLRNENNTVRIDIAGEVLHTLASCDNLTDYKTKHYLRTINGTPPDIYGNITFSQKHTDKLTPLRVITTDTDITIKRI